MVYQRKWNTTLLMIGLVLASSIELGAQAPTVSAWDGTAAPGSKLSAQDKNVAANVMAPRVTYQHGMLSISASNLTLGQVLRAVEAETGTSIDFPADAASERVAVELGPGTPAKVLAELLDGSRFNYVMVRVPGDSSRVQKLILTMQQDTQSVTVSSALNSGPASAPLVAKSGPQQADAVKVKREERIQFWLQIAQQHAQRMSDPANQNAGPPPPPPMETPPPTPQ